MYLCLYEVNLGACTLKSGKGFLKCYVYVHKLVTAKTSTFYTFSCMLFVFCMHVLILSTFYSSISCRLYSFRSLREDTYWRNLDNRLLKEDTYWRNLCNRLLKENTYWRNLGNGLLKEDTYWRNLDSRLFKEGAHWRNLSNLDRCSSQMFAASVVQ